MQRRGKAGFDRFDNRFVGLAVPDSNTGVSALTANTLLSALCVPCTATLSSPHPSLGNALMPILLTGTQAP